MFFWMYALIELLAMFLDSGVIPTSNQAYPVRKSAPFSLVVADRLTTNSGLLQCTQGWWLRRTAAS